MKVYLKTKCGHFFYFDNEIQINSNDKLKIEEQYVKIGFVRSVITC